MGRMREESLEEIVFGVMAIEMFAPMRKKYKGTAIGFWAEDCHKVAKSCLMKLVRKHEKEFGEKLDMELIKKL